MITTSGISVQRRTVSQLNTTVASPSEFGSQISDHMFSCEYKNGAWQTPTIRPFAPLALSPATLALHYGQSVFEGMKAFRGADGLVRIFRIARHYERFARSLERMCMPAPGKDLFEEALIELVRTDQHWLPSSDGTSLYIRPFQFASEARFGVKISEEYQFIIFTGPVPSLFQRPVRVKVETDFIRAAPGGTGYAKCAGNYGGAFYPTQQARKEGFDQVIWTTGGDHPMLEESGVMNLMFVVDDIIVTPPLSDTILDGVTRDSLITLARARGWTVEERPVSVTELISWCREKRLMEAFGTGTAAVVAPAGSIAIYDEEFELPPVNHRSKMMQLKAELEGIREGVLPDFQNWNTVLIN